MLKMIFLFVLALIWIIFAVIQDLKKNEIANWLNLSLIIFALGFRFFYSLFSDSFWFFYQGLLGLAIFFILGNLFYYLRFFAGGDAKLMIALGSILPIFESFKSNFELFFLFFLVFLIVGAIYGLSISIFLSLKNWRKFAKEFSMQLKKNKKTFYFILILGIFFIVFGFLEISFLFLGILIFIIPYLYLYAKSVDEACMTKKIKTIQLKEGDWLYKDVVIGKKLIKSSWDGLNKKEIKLLKNKKKEVKIKYGVPFSPVFLISFLVFVYLLKTGIWKIFLFKYLI